MGNNVKSASMNLPFIRTWAFVTVSFFACHAKAQSFSSSVINSGGGTAEHSSFSLIFSIGESVLASVDAPQPWHAAFVTTVGAAPITSVVPEEETYIHCYPVPVSKNLTIEKENEQVVFAAIHSLQGVKVLEVTLSNRITGIDVSDLVAGVYIIVFRTRFGVIKTQRLVKI
jgi:hypothetical protein